MKSNEDFIKGIYAKAKQREAEIEQTSSYVEKKVTFQRKIRYISAFAGAAACFVAGIFFFEKQDVKPEPGLMIARTGENPGDHCETGEFYIDCAIVSVSQKENTNEISATLYENQQEVPVVIIVDSKDCYGWETVGNEVLIKVSGPLPDGTYSMVRSSTVYTWDSEVNGEKIFKDKDHQMIKKSDLVQ